MIIFNEGNRDAPGSPRTCRWAPRASTSPASAPARRRRRPGDPGTVGASEDEVLEETATSVNVIAESAGAPNRTVVVARTSTASRRAGHQRNGSGSGGILEIAEQLSSRPRPPQQAAVMWYGAEERAGRIAKYSRSSARAKGDILAMLNFDMIGSPNFARFVYDATARSGRWSDRLGFLEDVFVDYFADVGLFNEPTAFDGGPTTGRPSPRGSRPAGCSRREGPKTAAQVARTAASRRSVRPCTTRRATRTREPERSGSDGARLGLVALDQSRTPRPRVTCCRDAVDVRNTPIGAHPLGRGFVPAEPERRDGHARDGRREEHLQAHA